MIRPPRKFEDLELGEERQSGSRLVTAEEMVEFAQKYDPQWFHADPDAALQSIFGAIDNINLSFDFINGFDIFKLWISDWY